MMLISIVLKESTWEFDSKGMLLLRTSEFIISTSKKLMTAITKLLTPSLAADNSKAIPPKSYYHNSEL
jgi:hypothetical protein